MKLKIKWLFLQLLFPLQYKFPKFSKFLSNLKLPAEDT